MDDSSLLINRDAAEKFQKRLDDEEAEREAQKRGTAVGPGASGGDAGKLVPPVTAVVGKTTPAQATHFFGTVDLDPVTATMEFSTIVSEVIQHFSAQAGVDVTISVEINACVKTGFDAATQRTVKENCGVLKFKSAQFEQ